MAGGSFAHFHVHSEYSLLDGMSHLDDLARAAAQDGQPALCVTDHGNLYGALELASACERHGVKPVVGMEAYFSPRGAGHEGPKERYHLVLVAASGEGFHALSRLSSRAFLEGFDAKPTIDLEMLAEEAGRADGGIVATTGCLGGIVPQLLVAGDEEGAAHWAGRLEDAVGKGNLYAEIQDHGIGDERRAMRRLSDLARRLCLPLLATNDSHYTRREDARVHEALLCVQTKATLEDHKRFRFDGAGYWFKTAAEMRALFGELPEACDETLALAERIETKLPLRPPTLPRLLGDAASEAETLRRQARAGAQRRFGDLLPKGVDERLERELSVIGQMGFPGYFLMVADLVSWARSQKIAVGPGRGSAAGSMVSYCLGITDLDPLAHGLLFERFLSEGRAGTLPDIDLDVDDRRRGELIEYLGERYGEERVAQIGTFGELHAKSALRDAARVLGKPYALGDALSRALPPDVYGRSVPLRACLEESEGHEDAYAAAAALRGLVERDASAREVVELALGLEGVKRSAGIHAAGVVVADGALIDLVPLQRQPGGGDGPAVTQWDLAGVERCGLVKFDLLGLRTLGLQEQAVVLARAAGEECCEVTAVPDDDEATWRLLRAKRTAGVFQLESDGMRRLMGDLEPDCFSDLAALVALYRPGPMGRRVHEEYARRKHGRAEIGVHHPDLGSLLSDTYGLLVFQEQLMAISRHFCGFSASEADALRKACGKKDPVLLASMRERFIAGCVAQDHSEALGATLFGAIEPFADYGFCKAHACAYALVAWRSAYLKAHHPSAFWAAVLDSVRGDYDSMASYLASARDEGVVVLAPDVNRSQAGFSVEGAAVRFGLGAVRLVGAELADAIVEERERSGPFCGLDDFFERMAKVRTNVAASLVWGGAFDAFGTRRTLARRVEELRGPGRRAAGVVPLFRLPGADGEGDAEGEGDAGEEARKEREALGAYLGAHPLERWEGLLRLAGVHDAGDAAAFAAGPEGAPSDLWAGVVADARLGATRRGGPMARATLEGRRGSATLLGFQEVADELCAAAGEPVVVEARALLDQGRGDERALLRCSGASGVEEYLDLLIARAPRGLGIVVEVDLARCDGADRIAELRRLADAASGETAELFVRSASTRQTWRLGARVDATRAWAALVAQSFVLDEHWVAEREWGSWASTQTVSDCKVT